MGIGPYWIFCLYSRTSRNGTTSVASQSFRSWRRSDYRGHVKYAETLRGQESLRESFRLSRCFACEGADIEVRLYLKLACRRSKPDSMRWMSAGRSTAGSQRSNSSAHTSRNAAGTTTSAGHSSCQSENPPTSITAAIRFFVQIYSGN